MFIIQIPKSYPGSEKLIEHFKELSLAYKVETMENLDLPIVLENSKSHRGIEAINILIKTLQDYYGADYNCSCAR